MIGAALAQHFHRNMSSSIASFAAAVVLVLLGTNLVVYGTPVGAPLVACSSMTPQHNVSAQTSPAPYATFPASSQMIQGESIRLTLRPVVAENIFFRGLLLNSFTATRFAIFMSKGFLVEAYDVTDPTGPIIGTFSDVTDGQILSCRNGPTPDVFHSQ